jgi:hypothetical protein
VKKLLIAASMSVAALAACDKPAPPPAPPPAAPAMAPAPAPAPDAAATPAPAAGADSMKKSDDTMKK